MIVRLGLLDRDEKYIKLLSAYFNEHSDSSFQIESYLFFDIENYRKFQKNGKKLDLLLASTELLVDTESVEDTGSVVYLTEDSSIKTWNDRPAVCKYQRADKLLMSVRGLAAGRLGEGSNFSLGTKGGIIAFMGAAGGVGTTTSAMGCACRMAMLGKSVLYFSVQQNARPESVFQSGASMSDVYYAYREWKSMGSNEGFGKLQLKLKSMVNEDSESGVASFKGFDLPLDALDIKASEISELVEVLSGLYDVVVVDIESRIDDMTIELLKCVDWMVMISDGSEKANYNLQRLSVSINELNNQTGRFSGQIGYLYNKFGSSSQRITPESYITDLGDIPRIINSGMNEIVRNLKNSEAYVLLEK